MNVLKAFVEHQIFIAESKLDSKYFFDFDMYLHEYRLIKAVGARQSGATTSIAEMFNVKTDIYVGYNSGCVYDFIHNKLDTKDHVCTNTLKTYDKYWNKCRGVVFPDEVKRVYLDIGKCIEKEELEIIIDDASRLYKNAYIIVT